MSNEALLCSLFPKWAAVDFWLKQRQFSLRVFFPPLTHSGISGAYAVWKQRVYPPTSPDRREAFAIPSAWLPCAFHYQIRPELPRMWQNQKCLHLVIKRVKPFTLGFLFHASRHSLWCWLLPWENLRFSHPCLGLCSRNPVYSLSVWKQVHAILGGHRACPPLVVSYLSAAWCALCGETGRLRLQLRSPPPQLCSKDSQCLTVNLASRASSVNVLSDE